MAEAERIRPNLASDGRVGALTAIVILFQMLFQRQPDGQDALLADSVGCRAFFDDWYQAIDVEVFLLPQFFRSSQTFAELANRLSRLASVLQQLGMGPGSRVGMLAFNSDRYVEFLYGVWWGGGVVNPVNVRWSAEEVAYLLDDCDTRILLVDDHHVSLAQQVRTLSVSLQTLVYVGDGSVPDGMLGHETLLAKAAAIADAHRSGDDLAAVMYTGGTTGKPKGVMITHSNLAINAVSALAAVNRPPQSVVVHPAPMFHIGGIGLTVQLMLRLCKQIVLPYFSEVAVLNAISEEKGSEIFLVPAMLKRVLDCPQFPTHDLSSLRLVLYGAAAIDTTLLNPAINALPQADFAQLYGMTELSGVATCLPAWCHTIEGQKSGKLRSAGLPIPFAEIRIVDGDGAALPSGSIGEIIVRGSVVMTGYWKKPEQTTDALRDGWMRTGDGGYMDADGFIFVVDRIKDMVVTGGENVYLAEVENAILQLPAVALCAVIGVPDDTWGSVCMRSWSCVTARCSIWRLLPPIARRSLAATNAQAVLNFVTLCRFQPPGNC